MGNGRLFPPGLKHRECEADHSHTPSAELKSEWSYASVPPYILMERNLIKHRETLYLASLTVRRQLLVMTEDMLNIRDQATDISSQS